MMRGELIGIFSRPAAAKGKIHVYQDQRSGHAVLRFMLLKKRRKKHLLTLPVAEFRRLSAAVLAKIGCNQEDFKSVNGGRL